MTDPKVELRDVYLYIRNVKNGYECGADVKYYYVHGETFEQLAKKTSFFLRKDNILIDDIFSENARVIKIKAIFINGKMLSLEDGWCWVSVDSRCEYNGDLLFNETPISFEDFKPILFESAEYKEYLIFAEKQKKLADEVEAFRKDKREQEEFNLYLKLKEKFENKENI